MDEYSISYAPSIAALAAAKRRLVVEQARTSLNETFAALKGRSYWHFATHGRFDWRNARASSLILANKIPLTLSALLATTDLGAPRLVVLSACETGLSDTEKAPDEFTGFPAGFLQVGAIGVLSTLWPVNDLSTALLVAKFYDNHLTSGLAPSAALREAQNWIRTATINDLKSYARDAVKDGRITANDADPLQGALRLTRSSRELIGDVLTLVHPNLVASTSSVQPVTPAARAAEPEPRQPFAHPYYWAGFTVTGL